METKYSLDRAVPLFDGTEIKKVGIEAILHKYSLNKNSSEEDIATAIKRCGVSYTGQQEAQVIKAVYYPGTNIPSFKRRRTGWC